MLEGVLATLRDDSGGRSGNDLSVDREIRPKPEGGMGNWRRGVVGGVGLAGVRGMGGSSALFFELSTDSTITGDRLEAFWTDFVCFGRINRSEKSSSTL